MILPIGSLLAQDLLDAVLALGKNDKLFVDGRTTAGWYAKQIKHNTQARRDATVTGLLDKIAEQILAHELVKAAARPKTLVRLMLTRYDPDMHYGMHVDDALMDGQRTDLSFTLFLSPPGSYEGGELMIDEPSAERAFKLEAGSLLLYPSNTLHRVAPVTGGQRLVVVGWIRSLIRDPVQRELLFDLERSIHTLRSQDKQQDVLPLLLKTRSNLLRMWAED